LQGHSIKSLMLKRSRPQACIGAHVTRQLSPASVSYYVSHKRNYGHRKNKTVIRLRSREQADAPD